MITEIGVVSIDGKDLKAKVLWPDREETMLTRITIIASGVLFLLMGGIELQTAVKKNKSILLGWRKPSSLEVGEGYSNPGGRV